MIIFTNVNANKKHKNTSGILIADLIRYGQFVETRLADEDLFSLRSLTRFRTYLVESISASIPISKSEGFEE